jgi:hypothetical protein
MIQGIYDIRREHAREYGKLAQQKYQWAVRPIYGIARPGVAPKHVGSSVLLSISGKKFLVTAGHVTDSAKITTLHVAGTKELIPLSFDAGLTTNPDIPRSGDVYDFSVCVLSDIMQRDLGDVRYITEKEIYRSAPFGRNRLRMVMGYPTSKNKRGIDNPRRYIGGTTWIYVSLPVNDTNTIEGIPDGDHLLVEFDHEKSLNPDGIGTHSIYPTGASGGAMFDLGKFDDPERLAKPAQCEAKLVGILTEYRSREKVIVATSMRALLDCCQRLV